MGSRPFIQQVVKDPIFVFWDLRQHPITVFTEWILNRAGGSMLQALGQIPVMAESNHPSICCHAFVERDRAYPHRGKICMEETPLRIVSLHRRHPGFDPVSCLLEQMRAAVRILRYGVRERDRKISQHNPYRPDEVRDYQALVMGWDAARDLAGRHNAEIVPYAR
jgi:hypothetical protein